MKSRDIYELVEAKEDLFEVAMNPSNLEKLASQVEGALVGIEFEMIVPGAEIGGDEDYDPEPDYDADESAHDIEDIINFFDGGYNSSYELDRARDELYELFTDYKIEKINDEWLGEKESWFYDWVKENISPSEMVEFLDIKLPDDQDADDYRIRKEDIDQFIDISWEDEDAYYESAKEEYENEKLDEDDFNERDFLRHIGIRYMSDVDGVLSRASLYWPHWTEPEYGDGNLDMFADSFSEAVGKRVDWSSEYHGASRPSDGYAMEPDGSLSGDDDEAGLEFISHPMPVDEMIEDLTNIKKWAKQNKAYTNKSTGLHINISVPGLNRDRLDFVKLVLLMGDHYVLQKFNRMGSGYAKSAMNIIKDRANDTDTTERLLEKLKSNMGEIASKILHSGSTEKFTSVNVKGNYIEFRGPGGNWLNKDENEIKDTINRFIVALDAAIDPEKYKKEYHKALYKLLKPAKGEEDTSSLAKYMSGKITKEEYTREIQLARKTRLRDKGINILDSSEVDQDDWVVSYKPGGENDKIFIQNNDKINTVQDAIDAARKFKPQWFKSGNTNNVDVKRFDFLQYIGKNSLYNVRLTDSYYRFDIVAENENDAVSLARKFAIKRGINTNRTKNVEVTKDDSITPKRLYTEMQYQQNLVDELHKWEDNPNKVWAWATNLDYYSHRVMANTPEDVLKLVQQVYPNATFENTKIQFEFTDNSEGSQQRIMSAHGDLINQVRAKNNAMREAEKAEPNSLRLYTVRSLLDGHANVVAKTSEEAKQVAQRAYSSTIQGSPDSWIVTLFPKDQYNDNILARYMKLQGDEPPAPQSGPNDEEFVVINNDLGEKVTVYAPNSALARSIAIERNPSWDSYGHSFKVLSAKPGSATEKPAQPNKPTKISDLGRYLIILPDGSRVNIPAYSVEDAQNQIYDRYGYSENEIEVNYLG